MRSSIPLVLLSVASTPLHAQAADSTRAAPERGAYSLSFEAPGFGSGGSGSFGFWKMVSGRTNLGINVRLDASRDENEAPRPDTAGRDGATTTKLYVAVGPAVRRYFAAGERTAPFAYAGAEAGVYTEERDDLRGFDAEARGVYATLRVGAGLEWFAVPGFSVSGYTGIAARADSRRNEFQAGEAEQSSLDLATFTSALSVNLYLPRRRAQAPAPPP